MRRIRHYSATYATDRDGTCKAVICLRGTALCAFGETPDEAEDRAIRMACGAQLMYARTHVIADVPDVTQTF